MAPGSLEGQRKAVPKGESVQLPADCEQLLSRAKTIPRLTWEQFRLVIEKLYIDEERKLSDVTQIMSQKHGFLAT